LPQHPYRQSWCRLRGTIYYDLTLAKEVMPKLTASAHAGYTDYKKDGDTVAGCLPWKVSYADYNVGLAYDLNAFTFGVKYFWNDAKAGTKTYATSCSKANQTLQRWRSQYL
jgi:hypothetical protein